jgi:GTP-binding protein
VDRKIAELVDAAGKPCLVVLNKWDVADQSKGPGAYLDYVRRAVPRLAYAPVSIASAKQGFRVWDLVETAEGLHRQAGTTVTTGQLNRLVKAAEEWAHPRITRGRIPKIYYATQVGARPLRFLLFVNDPAYFTADYRRFLAGKLRELAGCAEVPVRLAFRGKADRHRDR